MKKKLLLLAALLVSLVTFASPASAGQTAYVDTKPILGHNSGFAFAGYHASDNTVTQCGQRTRSGNPYKDPTKVEVWAKLRMSDGNIWETRRTVLTVYHLNQEQITCFNVPAIDPRFVQPVLPPTVRELQVCFQRGLLWDGDFVIFGEAPGLACSAWVSASS